ncbi:(4Fe-4S) protein, partial [Streptomyces sp. 150FB]|uniref:lactate utilisation protein LutB domain-containing protein n=1 Tax=Streptomyces sp. 150FB TaxID=1576605 RepID=UPI000589209A
VLVHLRERVADQGGKGHRLEKAAVKGASWVLNHPRALRAAQQTASRGRHLMPRRLPGPGSAWTDSRDIPELPQQSFRDWWKKTQKEAQKKTRKGGTTQKGGSPS